MANSNFVVQNGLTVGPLTISAVTGDITTTGNLFVTGPLGTNKISTDASNVSVTTNFVNVAIVSSNVASVSSTGLSILPATASTTYTDGALVVAGGVGIAGNVHIQSTKILHVGPDLIGAYSNVLAQFNANVNSYSQILVQNISNGISASADVVVVADTGSDSANYVDMGINSSNYSDVSYTIGTGLDAYTYSNGGNYAIGTQTAGKGLIFHTGGTLSAQLRAKINDTGLTVNTTTGNLFVTGPLGTNKISTDASNVSVTTNFVNVAIVSSNVASVSSTGLSILPATASTTYTDGALVVAGGVGIAGNVHIQSTKILHVGPDLIGAYSNVLAQFNANVNSYSQILLQNISNGTSASADVVVVADTGSDSANYVDMGINSSNYSDVAYTIGTGLDAYTYSNGGNYAIGTQTSGKGLVFHTGGTLSANLRAKITDAGLSVNTTTATSSVSTGALVVNGGCGIAGDLRLGGNLYVTNIISSSSQTITVNDPLLYLTTSAPYPYNYDIGFYSAFTGGTANVYAHTGVVRNDSDSTWSFFSNVAEPAGGQVSLTNAVYDAVNMGALTIKDDPLTRIINGGTSGVGNIGAAAAIFNTVFATTLQGTLTTVSQPNITTLAGVTSIGASGSTTITGILQTAAQTNVTSLGTLAGVTVSSTIAANANNTINIGASGTTFATVYATTFSGVSTTAKYADLAENYQADAEYAPGTVVHFGGEFEVTACDTDGCTSVAGIVSTNPAHLMNTGLEGANVVAVALNGRVPCQVQGIVAKGDLMVSAGNGRARAEANPKVGSVIGKALANSEGDAVIEVVVGVR